MKTYRRKLTVPKNPRFLRSAITSIVEEIHFHRIDDRKKNDALCIYSDSPELLSSVMMRLQIASCSSGFSLYSDGNATTIDAVMRLHGSSPYSFYPSADQSVTPCLPPGQWAAILIHPRNVLTSSQQ